MKRNFGDEFRWPSYPYSSSPLMPDFRPRKSPLPSWRDQPWLNPNSGGNPLQEQQPPQLPDFHIWRDLPSHSPRSDDVLPGPLVPPVQVPPGGGFPEPPRPPHEVDPPDENPYNDPDYNPNFLVTQNRSEGRPSLPGGLLGMLERFGGFADVDAQSDASSRRSLSLREFTRDDEKPIWVLVRRT